jgi:hypothetical protein
MSATSKVILGAPFEDIGVQRMEVWFLEMVKVPSFFLYAARPCGGAIFNEL